MIGRGRGQLHEMPDQLATLKTLLKFAERIEHPTEAPQVMARAFQAMTFRPPGPVAVEMPWDMFPASAEVTPMDPLGKRANPVPDPEKIAALAKLVDGAKAPMIWVGGGAVDAGPEILALAEKIGAPVVSFRMGKGVVDSRHPLSLNTLGGFELWDTTDLLIGIGTRLDVPIARWAPAPAGLKIARIDIDPAEYRRQPVDVAITADAADGARGAHRRRRAQGRRSGAPQGHRRRQGRREGRDREGRSAVLVHEGHPRRATRRRHRGR